MNEAWFYDGGILLQEHKLQQQSEERAKALKAGAAGGQQELKSKSAAGGKAVSSKARATKATARSSAVITRSSKASGELSIVQTVCLIIISF